jgi:outer membrane protein assembly factor BamB
MFAFIVMLSIPGEAQEEGPSGGSQSGGKLSSDELPNVTIFPPFNAEDDPRYNEVCKTIADTLALNIKLIGEQRVEEAAKAVTNLSAIETYAKEEQVDNTVFGRLYVDENSEIVIEMSVYTREAEEVTMSKTETAESLLGIFDASDRIITALIGAFSDRHITYGSLQIKNRGAQGHYRVVVGENEIGTDITSIPRMLTGTYHVSIIQKRLFETVVATEEVVEIQEEKESLVSFALPFITEEEAQRFTALDRQIWEGWETRGEMRTGDDDGEDEVLATFDEALDLTEEAELGSGIEELHNKYRRWREEYLQQGGEEEQQKASKLLSGAKQFPLSYQIEPYLPILFEPKKEKEIIFQQYEQVSTVGSLDAITPDRRAAWTFSPGEQFRSIPAIGKDGTLYVGSYDENLYALNPDLTRKWSFNTEGQIWTSPAVGDDGTVYIGSDDGNVYAVHPDRTVKWIFTTGGYVHSSPAISSDGTVYVGSNDNKLYAIGPDGSEKWSFSTGKYVGSSPVIGDRGTIYFGSADNTVYALNPDGTLKWSFETGNAVYASPAIGEDGTIYIGSYDNDVYALNPDGTEKWRFHTENIISSSCVIGTDGTIYVGSCDNNIYAIKPDGSKKWSFSTGNAVNTAPTLGADGTIYVGSWDRNLYALNPYGTEKWSYPTGDAINCSPVIGNDGTIYIGSDDGTLYGIPEKSGGPADTPWPMFHQNNRHTGRAPAP